MNKFKVGDLITDKEGLFQVIAVDEKTYTVKKINSNEVNASFKVSKYMLEGVAIKYDLSKPLMKTIYKGVCRCAYCDSKLNIGDSCVRYAGAVYCDDDCLFESIDAIAEDDVIDENDLDDSSKSEKPLFELTEGQLKLIEYRQKGETK